MSERSLFDPVMPCEQNEVVGIISANNKSLDNEFIPIVSFDTEFTRIGYRVIESKKETTSLSDYLDSDKRVQPLSTILIDGTQNEITLRFKVERGSINANDNEGMITAVPMRVELISKKNIKLKYGWRMLLKFNIKDFDKSNAYVDFNANGTDFFTSVKDVHCGRIAFKPLLANVIVIDGRNRPDDKALQMMIRAVNKLDSSVTVIYVRNIGELNSKLSNFIIETGQEIKNLVLFGHGRYRNSGISIGEDYVSKNEDYTKLGNIINPYLSYQQSKVLLYSCHAGTGTNLTESKENLQHFAKATEAEIMANMTWGVVTEDIFTSGRIITAASNEEIPEDRRGSAQNSENNYGYSMKCLPDGTLTEKIKVRITNKLEFEIEE